MTEELAKCLVVYVKPLYLQGYNVGMMTIRRTQMHHRITFASIALLALISFTHDPVFASSPTSNEPGTSTLPIPGNPDVVNKKIEAAIEKIVGISNQLAALIQEIKELMAQQPEPPSKPASTASIELFNDKMNNWQNRVNQLNLLFGKVSGDLEQANAKLAALQSSYEENQPQGSQADSDDKKDNLTDSTRKTRASLARPTPEKDTENSSERSKSANPFKRSTGQATEEQPSDKTSQSGSCNSTKGLEGLPMLGLILIPAGMKLRRRRI